MKGAARIGVATIINPILGGAAFIVETMRAAMTAIDDENGTKAGKALGVVTDGGSAIDSLLDD